MKSIEATVDHDSHGSKMLKVSDLWTVGQGATKVEGGNVDPQGAVPRPGNHGNHRWKISAVQIWVGLVIQNPNLPKIMLRNRNRRWRHLFHSRMAPSPWPPIILHGRGVKRLNAEFPICSLNLIDPFRHLPHLRKTRGFLLLLSSFFLGSSSDENLEPPATSESPKYVGMSDGSSRKNPNL